MVRFPPTPVALPPAPAAPPFSNPLPPLPFTARRESITDPTVPSPWVGNASAGAPSKKEEPGFLPHLTRAAALLNERSASGALPAVSRFGVWAAIVSHLMDRFVEGYARVKKCSELGRGLMSFDVGTVYAHAVKLSPVVPSCLSRDKAHVDSFVKAFYETQEGALLEWMKAHRAAYPLRQTKSLLVNGLGATMKKKDALKHALAALEEMYVIPETSEVDAVAAAARAAGQAAVSTGTALEKLGGMMMGVQ